jgi:Activator of Hsp90 ATPase homolog 1-like protein
MTEQRPFRVEVVVEAPREEVWRALTEPERVARWFGWDYDGLEGEIKYIFVDHARQDPPALLVLDDGEDNQTIELVEEGPRTRVICVRPGSLEGADWDDLYEDVREGWITFFNQLRHSVERHPDEDRRTIRLTGDAVPADVVEALGREVGGPVWHEGRFQYAVAAGGDGDVLVGVHPKLPIDAREPAPVALTVTSYGLDETALEALRDHWQSWWAERT